MISCTPEYLVIESGVFYSTEEEWNELLSMAHTLLESNPLATPEDFAYFVSCSVVGQQENSSKAKPKKWYNISTEGKFYIVFGLLVTWFFLYSLKGMIDEKKALQDTNVNRDNKTVPDSIVSLGKQEPGTVSMEDLGIKVNTQYSIEQVNAAEDPELWEIEQFDGKFYKVRREDYDADYYGEDELDCEEYIGDENDF